MKNLIWILIVLSVASLVLAVIAGIMDKGILGIAPEGFSNGCTNLAVIAIAMKLMNSKKEK